MRTPTALVVSSLFGALLDALLASHAAAGDDALRTLDDVSLRGATAASFPGYLELLSLPNDSAVPADIQRNAAWLEAALGRRGFRTRLCRTAESRSFSRSSPETGAGGRPSFSTSTSTGSP